MEEGVVVVVVVMVGGGGGGRAVVGRLGGLGVRLGVSLLRGHEGGAVAAGRRCAGSPAVRFRGRCTGRHAFVEIIAARQQVVVGQAPVARRVVRRRLIGQALEARRGGGRLGDVGGARRGVSGAGRSRRHSRQDGGVGEGGVRAPAEGVAGDASSAPSRLSSSSTLPPLAAASFPAHSVRGGVPAVQAGLRAEARLLARLEEGGGVPGTANALPLT